MDYYISNGQLYHHGILGMKWGVRRFQTKSGSLTSAGKKRYQTREERVRQKQRAKALEKARETRKTNAEREAEKQRILKSGKAEDILKIKDRLTNAELSTAVERIRLEQNLASLANKPETSKGKEFITKHLGEAGKKVLWDTTVDLAAQAVKTVMAKKVNELLNDKGEKKEYVFTNNKKK